MFETPGTVFGLELTFVLKTDHCSAELGPTDDGLMNQLDEKEKVLFPNLGTVFGLKMSSVMQTNRCWAEFDLNDDGLPSKPKEKVLFPGLGKIRINCHRTILLILSRVRSFGGRISERRSTRCSC